MKIKIKGLGEFQLTPGIPLKSLIPEIKKISSNLPVGFKYNQEYIDWHFSFNEKDLENLELEPIFPSDEEALIFLRHTASHALAQAVKELFPGAKLGIGPPTEDGFYYDIYYEKPFNEEDLQKIEERIKEIIKKDLPLERKEIPKEEAKELFKNLKEDFKLELIEELPDSKVSIYSQENFIDLCKGPHLLSTGEIKAVKLLSVAGAYWRGNEKNPMLWRIYGTAFFSEEELKAYLDRLEEIKKRDHRRLGKELELFTIEEDIGPGLVIWLPKGAIIRNIIENFWKEVHLKRGYQLVYTPHIALRDLWKVSGHLDFYIENMFPPMELENRAYQLKPMNCPFHIYVYNQKRRSYREFPIRYCELGTVYRFERSGVLHGLLRVRGFTQDDAHIFCREDQLEEELIQVLDLVIYFLKVFGFSEYKIFLSTRPEKFVGSPEIWDKAESALKSALENKGLEYEIDPGEGVFYGPKIDLKIKDVLGRFWQCSTIQVDFNIPERFDIVYIGEDNKFYRPIMIHRALLGSLERFLGVLIENYAGAFPFWISPVQIKILTITDRTISYGEKIVDILRKEGFRVETDFRNEKLNYKIRIAQQEKVPYMIILGDKEEKDEVISVRTRKGEVINNIKLEEFINKIKLENQPEYLLNESS
ncbi:threonyl-tRNA synthetase [Thermodesulfobacterium geofontis OPF15]|uniref:Threonine--tRNA ligase n=1 Tax=Thermodesulfobacterium geofontis (strain OPF15) TaxID=795359 RepID=F8C505_THEGP|nr:threonine--tRNA ligase [Thermodesulfobacterium geofontis]AEH22790.1 threonyl-tRNA synthetase [Thermodesulfobacterium geofontis OPF15]